MIYTYASSYISGFEKLVETILKSQIKDVEIIKHLDGLIVYTTKLEFSKLKLRCFNNTYQVLAMASTEKKLPYETALKKFVHQRVLNLMGISNNIPLSKQKSFKIMPFDGNVPIRIDFDIIHDLEHHLQHELKLNIGFKKHDFDIILLRRTEGVFLLLFKLTYNRMTEKCLNRGELRPELSYFLSWISELKANDIVIDPFCGYGSIPKEIVKNFSYNMLFASDIDPDLINRLKVEFKKNKKNLFIKQKDALDLSYFEDNFFDKIITDPPWNIYNFEAKDFSVFYKKMFKEFYRILKPNGICTLLMGNVKDFEKALDFNRFKLIETFHILVNGKKANVYKLVKV